MQTSQLRPSTCCEEAGERHMGEHDETKHKESTQKDTLQLCSSTVGLGFLEEGVSNAVPHIPLQFLRKPCMYSAVF